LGRVELIVVNKLGVEKKWSLEELEALGR